MRVATRAEYVSAYVCDCWRMCVSMYGRRGDSVCHRRFGHSTDLIPVRSSWLLSQLTVNKENLHSKSGMFGSKVVMGLPNLTTQAYTAAPVSATM